MNANAEPAEASGRYDSLIWIVVAAVVVGGIAGNWYFEEWSWLYRAPTLLALTALAVWLALFTQRGKAVWDLVRESRTELRRVIYPSVDETRQTTLIVVGIVILMSLILWLLDVILGFFVSRVIG